MPANWTPPSVVVSREPGREAHLLVVMEHWTFLPGADPDLSGVSATERNGRNAPLLSYRPSLFHVASPLVRLRVVSDPLHHLDTRVAASGLRSAELCV